VVQVLGARGLLEHVDFLSTVSGGGYTGSFLTATLGDIKPHDDAAAPYAADLAPLEYKDVARPHGPDPAPIRYLRYHAKFLTNRRQSQTELVHGHGDTRRHDPELDGASSAGRVGGAGGEGIGRC
jgi:hypothetical protein